MAGNKTRDGIKISTVKKMLEKIPGMEIRRGTNHPFIANYMGMRPCPIASSTDVRSMVTPWIKEAVGYDRHKAYQSFKMGDWYM